METIFLKNVSIVLRGFYGFAHKNIKCLCGIVPDVWF